MRRLCRLATGAGLVAMLALGCGSSAEDAAVMRFVGFDASDISQPDTVTATSAEVCVNNPNLSGDLTSRRIIHLLAPPRPRITTPPVWPSESVSVTASPLPPPLTSASAPRSIHSQGCR